MDKNTKNATALHVARDIFEDFNVNQSVGLTVLVFNKLPKDKGLFLHNEDGVLRLCQGTAVGQDPWGMINSGRIPLS